MTSSLAGRNGLVVCILAIALWSRVALAGGDEKLVGIVRANLHAQRLLLEKLDVVYAARFPDGLHECRWVSDGAKVYASHIVVGPTSIGMPAEAAWNGEAGAMRIGAGAFYRVNDRSRLQIPMQPPHDGLLGAAEVGLGLKKASESIDDFKLTQGSAKQLSPDEIELRFESVGRAGRSEVFVFDRRVGYWPTKVTRLRAGNVLAVVAADNYVNGDLSGSTWWYPCRVTTTVNGADNKVLRTYQEIVKNAWLKVGETPRAETFNLEPMPNEWVYSPGSEGIARAPVDKSWKPDVRELRFPWTAWYAYIQNVDGVQSERDQLLVRFGADCDTAASNSPGQRSSRKDAGESYATLLSDAGLSNRGSWRIWNYSVVLFAAVIVVLLARAVVRRRAVSLPLL